MADPVNGNEAEEELVDYEEEEANEPDQAAKGEEGVKRGYVGLQTASFKEFLLKPEILRAITNNAFEHPSEGACSDLVELGRSVVSYAKLSRRLDDTEAFLWKLQCSISVYLARPWGQTFFARPSQGWERPLSLCCQFFSRLKLRATTQRWPRLEPL